MEQLIDRYIRLLKEKGDNDEKYKWNAIEHFQQNWDIEASDFYKMFKEAFRLKENLFYQISWGFINKATKHFPEQVRKMFKQLYEEEIPLEQRIADFQNSSEELLPKVKDATGKEKLNHQQDERTISVYLSFRYPERHFIYMPTFYTNYCSVINEPVAATNKRYLHYLKLAKNLRDNFVAENEEIQKLHRNIFPQTSWNSDNLVTQNILFLLLKDNDMVEKFDSNAPGYIMVNITWNSNNWQSPSDDSSSHRWVNDGNIPHESWNFDFSNPRNTENKIYGYSQWTRPPKLIGDNNLVVFYSQGKIVGFYGKAELLKEPVEINQDESYNIIGEKDISLVLENKIEDIKSKGYFEQKQRMGQNGFIYLKNKNTILNILNEAKSLNPEVREKLERIETWLKSSNIKNTPDHGNTKETDLNLILFGPPGTGKTYNTVDKALAIIHGDEFIKANNRKTLINEFNKLKEAGQIEFITFHQSFSYEDFVEGIKPVMTQEDEEEKGPGIGDIKYEIRDGIFKKMCSRAKGVSSGVKKEDDAFDFDNATYFKMSIGGKQKPQIHEWCIENNKLGLGWGEDNDYSALGKYVGNWKQFRDTFKDKFPETAENNSYNIQAMHAFMKMKKGDIVLISKGNKVIDAIGIIKDNQYIYDDTQDFGYYQFRNVEWIATDLNASPELFVRKNLSQQSIYEFYEKDIKKEYLKKEFLSTRKDNTEEKFVLIIDEINRGNIASIFGELITLIEPDKRIGAENELFVRLPYSGHDGEHFGVPSNLYIIGTMNTADRSIEALDTALRRRFSFVELPPNPALVSGRGSNLAPDGMIDDVEVGKLLQTINDRIEKLIDKDHKIGHSYFMKIEKTKEGLKQVFYDKIIPLLEEYFFGDFGKIGLILGSSFVEKVNNNNGFDFANFPEYSDLRTDLTEKAIYRIKSQNEWDFVSIYSNNKEQ